MSSINSHQLAVNIHQLAKYKGDDDSITYAALSTELALNPGRINEKDADGKTPLHWASINDHLWLAKMLLDKGANIDILDKNGYTCLHFACMHLFSKTGIADHLVSRGASINIRAVHDGSTPLYWASYYGNSEVVQTLISKGAALNLQDDNGVTPLSQAVSSSNIEVVKILLNNYADVNIADKEGNTPLHIAINKNLKQVARFILDKNPDLAKRNLAGRTPFDYDVVTQFLAIRLQEERELNVQLVNDRMIARRQFKAEISKLREARFGEASSTISSVEILSTSLLNALRALQVDYEDIKTISEELISLKDAIVSGPNKTDSDSNTLRNSIEGRKSHSTGEDGTISLESPLFVNEFKCSDIVIFDVISADEDDTLDANFLSSLRWLTGLMVKDGEALAVVIKTSAEESTIKNEVQILSRIASSSEKSGCISMYYSTQYYTVLESYGHPLRELLFFQVDFDKREFVEKIVLAVSHLHKLNIMHGNLTSSSVLYDINGSGEVSIKLCDLDYAREVGDACLHRDGIFLCDPEYMPPEIYNSKPGELKAALESDLFSLGLVLYQLLNKTSTCVLPVHNGNMLDQVMRDQTCMNNLVRLEYNLIYQPYLHKLCNIARNRRGTIFSLLRLVESHTPTNFYEKQKQADERLRLSENRSSIGVLPRRSSVSLNTSHAIGEDDRLSKESSFSSTRGKELYPQLPLAFMRESVLIQFEKVKVFLQGEFVDMMSWIFIRDASMTYVGDLVTIFDKTLNSLRHCSIGLVAPVRGTQAALVAFSQAIDTYIDTCFTLAFKTEREISDLPSSFIASHPRPLFDWQTELQVIFNYFRGMSPISTDFKVLLNEITTRIVELRLLVSGLKYNVITFQKQFAHVRALFTSDDKPHGKKIDDIIFNFQSLISRDNEIAKEECKIQEQTLQSFIATLTRSLTELIEAPADLTMNIKALQIQIKKNKALIQFVDESPPRCPLLAIVLPVSNTVLQYAEDDESVLTFRLFFVCSQTLQIVPSGPNGLGYIITKYASWLQRASSLLLFSLVLVRYAYPSTCLPYPCAGISLQAIESSIERIRPGLLKSLSSSEALIDVIHSLEPGYIKSLHAIMEVVKEEDEFMTESRLRLVQHINGRCAWIWDIDEVEDSFRLDQNNLLPGRKDQFSMLRAMDAIAASFSASLCCDTENLVVKWNHKKNPSG